MYMWRNYRKGVLAAIIKRFLRFLTIDLFICQDLKARLHRRFLGDFLLLMDVKEWMSYKRSRLWNFITTSLSNLLLHILQKEKIATKIAAKIACVLNGPWQLTSTSPQQVYFINYLWSFLADKISEMYQSSLCTINWCYVLYTLMLCANTSMS
jgi:hypothetical protein